MEKRRFISKGIDLDRVSVRIENFLAEKNYQVASSKDSVYPQHHLIQARKRDVLHRIFGSNCTDISIQGSPYEFELSVGSGIWGKTLGLYTHLNNVSPVDTVARINQLYRAKKFEENLWSYIQDQIIDLENSYSLGESKKMKEYFCDYIQGNPGWNKPILRGKLILAHQQGQRYLMFNMGEDRGVMIPALKMVKAEIISKKTKIANPSRIVRFTFYDQKEKKRKPIFNFSDKDIRSIFAGINEIVSGAKQEKLTVKALG